jgi:hypothetical protein
MLYCESWKDVHPCVHCYSDFRDPCRTMCSAGLVLPVWGDCMLAYRSSLRFTVVVAACAAHRMSTLERDTMRLTSVSSGPLGGQPAFDWHFCAHVLWRRFVMCRFCKCWLYWTKCNKWWDNYPGFSVVFVSSLLCWSYGRRTLMHCWGSRM